MKTALDVRVVRGRRARRLARVMGAGLGLLISLISAVVAAHGQDGQAAGSSNSSAIEASGSAGSSRPAGGEEPVGSGRAASDGAASARAARFLRGRVSATPTGGESSETQSQSQPQPRVSAAAEMGQARREHVAMVLEQRLQSVQARAAGVGAQGVAARIAPLSVAWQAVGPGSVATSAYGRVSGRVTAVAIDPTDTSGNTVYVGTTGGGVWKSVNAAGESAAVSFVPLTDTLPVFSANAGSSATASLSIGAVSVGVVAGGTVVLAGTGDTNDATDSYYGSGLLRSADGGVNWTLVQGSKDGVAGNHSWMGLGFAGFAWSSTVPGLVVAAVADAGESAIVNGVDAANSVMGIYFSTDAGVTWHMSTLMDGSAVVQQAQAAGSGQTGNAATAVVWNPVRQRFYAAVRYHGYYQSADGVTWTRLAGSGQAGTGLTTTACPPSPNSTGSAACPIFRGALAVQAVSGDTFGLTVDANNADQGLWQDICTNGGSGCSGAIGFSRRIGGTALEVGGGNSRILQGDYNLALAAVSFTGAGGVADTAVYVGTVDVYKCTLRIGCSLRNTTNGANGCGAPAKVAVGQHAIAALAGAGTGGALPLVYLGNDGGVWRSLDGINELAPVCSADDAAHFDNLNGGMGSLGEVVSFAQHPTDAGQLLVGLGANGTAGTGAAFSAGPGLSVWGQLSAAEGGAVAIDAANPLLWYVSTGAGVSVKACSNGTGCTAADFAGTATVGTVQVGGDAALIDAAWVLDPLVPAEMVVGTCRIWRGSVAGGSAWSSANAISRMFGVSAPVCGASGAYVRSLGAGGTLSNSGAAQNAGATVLYAGMAGALDGGSTLGGHVFMTAAGGTAGSTTAWTDVAGTNVTNDVASAGRFNPGGFDVSSVVVDGHDATGRTVYATVMGFAGNGVNAPHVYRSVDGGGHWTNISGNLPNAPANGVVVDPNDANTLYVAMDTGVYVTSSVSSCATTNCWSVLGAGLPNSPVVQLTAAVGMATGDGRTGELRAGTYGRGIWQIPLLTANTGLAAMSVAPGALTFAAQQVETASAAQSVTITDSGSVALVVSAVNVTGDFHSTDSCVGSSVAMGASCTVAVSFLPSAVGVRSGVLTVFGNVPGGQASVTLTGTGLAVATIVLNPVTLTFAATTVGATSLAQNVTISNTGGVASALGAIAVSGDFVLSANTCGSSLAVGVGCTVGITLRPSAAGTRTGTLTVTDDQGTQTAALNGSGIAAASDGLSPLSLTFAVQQVGTTSGAQQVTLTNSGDVALTLIAAQITAGDFIVVNSCGNSLNARSSCTISVSFAPRSVGAGSGLMTVTDQFRVQTVVLNGTGIAAAGVSLTPVSPVGFGIVAVGGSSAPMNVTLTNNSSALLSVQSIVVAGDFAILGGSNPCGSTVAVGAACTFQVSFVPAAGGPRNGTLTVTNSAAGSPQVLALTGTGVDFTLTANGSTNVTVANGKNAVFPLLLSSGANVPGTVAFSCSGAPAHSSCVVSPASAALGGTTTISATLLTQVGALKMPGQHRMIWLAGLLPLGLLVRRRWAAGLVMLCLLAGCGSGRKIPTDGSGSSSGALTPSGTYTVVVSGTSAGLVRSVSLTLVVQ